MLGDFTWTSAMSGAATNTVEAAPGSLIAVPLFISRVSVGCCGGTTWLWANGRPGAPDTVDCAGVAPGGVGWTGTGRACTSRICAGGATVSDDGVASCAGGADTACAGDGTATVGVKAAVTTGARAGKAVGAAWACGFASAALASTDLAAAGSAVVGAGAAPAVIFATRSASRRLSSSATLSVGVVRECFFAAGLGLGLIGAAGAS